MLSGKSGSALRMLQQQHSSLVHSRPSSPCVRAKAFSSPCNNAQVNNSSTLTASAQPGRVAVCRQESLPGLSCHGPLSKRQVLEKGIRIVDGALAETVHSIKKGEHGEKATRVLELLAEAYADSLKVGLSRHLQVLPSLANKPDFLGKAQRLAFEVLDTLNGVNWRAGLDWVGLGPVAGAPLLQSMMAHGHVSTLGLPIYVDQPHEPFTLGLPEFNAITMTDANMFVGGFTELYWDDAMMAHPDPFPVVAKAQLAQQVLTPPLMATVLARFEAGRRLLGVASSLGLGGRVVGGADAVLGSSWFDLGLTHPQAVLGVLLLSQPNLPLAAYLRSAFAATVGVSRGLVASFAAAPMRMQLPTKVQDDAVVACDGRGGRDWPRHGNLTAVGAGDADGLRQQPLLLPALQARERECVAAALLVQGESLAAAGHRRGIFGRVRHVVGSVWRAVRCA